MTACPKCGHVRKPSDTAPELRCPSCGVAYAKSHAAAPVAADVAPVDPQLIVESTEGLGSYAVGAIVWVGFVALVVSHGASFYANYLRSGRDRSASAGDSFGLPYPRAIVLHACIMGGGYLIASYGSTMALLTALVIGKTVVDLGLHQWSNRA